ncbi:MAG: integrin alpha [Planctomycetota bacterium]
MTRPTRTRLASCAHSTAGALLLTALPALLPASPQGPIVAHAGQAASADTLFVEPVVTLQAIDGDEAGAQFGWVARTVGDVDGDGALDYGVTAPFQRGGAGRVDVHSGRTGARLFRFEGEPGSLLGWVVAPGGDLDGDGKAEVLVGAPGRAATGGATPDPGLPGRVVVLRGRDGSVLLDLRGESPADRFGEDIAPAPDLDGDGVGDIVVGAPNARADGRGPGAADGSKASDAGAVFLCSGATGARIAALRGAAGSLFGNSVACAPDARVLAVAALNGGDGQRGEVHVYALPGLAPMHVVRAREASQNLGWFLSLVPDRDRDGVHEVYATDWHDGGVRGRALVTSGATGATLLDLAGERRGVGFGIGVGGRDDFDGDGVADLVIGAWLEGSYGAQCGRVDVCSGRDGALLGRVTGRVPGAVLGFDADTLGDVNGDGVPDLLITAAYQSARGPKSGRVYVLSGASVVALGASARNAEK